jgi:hypothetical protein
VESTNNNAPETPVSAAPSLDTYEGIKYARKNKPLLPTQEQFEKALLAQRQKVADLAVAAAVASGESHTQSRLPFPVETQGAQPWELREQAAKSARHLSKLVYFYAKFQAGKFHEELDHVYAAAPDDDYDPSEDEEPDEDDTDYDDESA